MLQRDRNPLTVPRNLIAGLLLGLAAVSWICVVWIAERVVMPVATPTMGMQAPLFLAVWIVMMVAMMFPAAVPMVLIFHQVQVAKQNRGATFTPTWIFVAGYTLIWSICGVVAYAGAVGAEAIAESIHLSAQAAARIGGVILVFAGIYQLSPLKDLCLAKCRTPMTFIVTSWRDGIGGALLMGLKHGTYCLGCCWLLFAILFPLGIMNIAAMAVITLLIFAEKALRYGRQIASIAGAAMVLYGVLVSASPEMLPGFGNGSEMSMSSPGNKMQSSAGIPVVPKTDAKGPPSR